MRCALALTGLLAVWQMPVLQYFAKGYELGGHFAGRANCSEGVVTMRDYGRVAPLQAAGYVRKGRRDSRDRSVWPTQPGMIVVTARKLFELQGVWAISFATIAREANVARELVYYHFANRNGLIEAVIDDYVEDLVESVIVWDEARALGDTPGSLKKCIQTL